MFLADTKMLGAAAIQGWGNWRLVLITQTNYSTTIVEKNTEKV